MIGGLGKTLAMMMGGMIMLMFGGLAAFLGFAFSNWIDIVVGFFMVIVALAMMGYYLVFYRKLRYARRIFHNLLLRSPFGRWFQSINPEDVHELTGDRGVISAVEEEVKKQMEAAKDESGHDSWAQITAGRNKLRWFWIRHLVNIAGRIILASPLPPEACVTPLDQELLVGSFFAETRTGDFEALEVAQVHVLRKSDPPTRLERLKLALHVMEPFDETYLEKIPIAMLYGSEEHAQYMFHGFWGVPRIGETPEETKKILEVIAGSAIAVETKFPEDENELLKDRVEILEERLKDKDDWNFGVSNPEVHTEDEDNNKQNVPWLTYLKYGGLVFALVALGYIAWFLTRFR